MLLEKEVKRKVLTDEEFLRLKRELSDWINTNSLDSYCGMPDYIIAHNLMLTMSNLETLEDMFKTSRE